MKKIKLFLILLIFLLTSNKLMAESKSIYDFNFLDIEGNKVELSIFKGKPLLIVNTASRCGFTPQYEGLQNLFTKYRKTDLTIIATTSNSFNQEFDDPENQNMSQHRSVDDDIGVDRQPSISVFD